VRQRLIFLVVTWAAAYVLVMVLFLVLGSWLQELSVAARAAVISAWMVVWMTQLIIPVIRRVLPPPR